MLFIAPLWKRGGGGGIIGFGLSVIPSIRSSVRLSVIIFSFPLNILNSFKDFNKILNVHWYWHDLDWDSCTTFFFICTRVMPLDLRQNFVSTQYLENKLTDFLLILYMHSYWQDVAWDCYTSFFTLLCQSYGPWFTPKFLFHSMSREQMDRILPNFISRPKGREFEPHRRHCVVVLEQDTFILA